MNKGVTATFQHPLRQLTVVASIFNQPSIDVLNALACVNDRPWQGLNKGYWLFNSFDVVPFEPTDDFEECIAWTVKANFISYVHQDWCQYHFMRLPNGDFAPVGDESLKAVRNRGYGSGTETTTQRGDKLYTDGSESVDINLPNGSKAKAWSGFAKYSLYPQRDFYSIFGI
jgi:hypothetical protein